MEPAAEQNDMTLGGIAKCKQWQGSCREWMEYIWAEGLKYSCAVEIQSINSVWVIIFVIVNVSPPKNCANLHSKFPPICFSISYSYYSYLNTSDTFPNIPQNLPPYPPSYRLSPTSSEHSFESSCKASSRSPRSLPLPVILCAVTEDVIRFDRM